MNEKKKLCFLSLKELSALAHKTAEAQADFASRMVAIADEFGVSRDDVLECAVKALMKTAKETTFEDWTDGETEEGEAE